MLGKKGRDIRGRREIPVKSDPDVSDGISKSGPLMFHGDDRPQKIKMLLNGDPV